MRRDTHSSDLLYVLYMTNGGPHEARQVVAVPQQYMQMHQAITGMSGTSQAIEAWLLDLN